MFNLLEKFYIIETLMLSLLMYLLGTLIHLSFNLHEWSIYTRIFLALLILLIIFGSLYVFSKTQLKKAAKR